MLELHVAICFIGLAAGALVLVALCQGVHRPISVAVLLGSTALISLTGFALQPPPGTPTPDPALVVGIVELIVVVIAAFALYGNHLARAWRAAYLVTVVLAVYFNAFVAVVQGFLKVEFLHGLAPTAKEPPFLVAQLLTLALFVVVGVLAFRRLPRRAVTVTS